MVRHRRGFRATEDALDLLRSATTITTAPAATRRTSALSTAAAATSSSASLSFAMPTAEMAFLSLS